MKSILLTFILSLLLSTSLIAQDTLAIYFEFGQSKIAENQINILDAIPVKFDLSSIDSVHFIGMADSVGNAKSNRRLAERRAKNVLNYCKDYFQDDVKVSLFSLGEKTNPELDQNRRVDIIFYFQNPLPEESENVENTEDTTQTEAFCYTIDYSLLHRSQVRSVSKNKKEWVVIETQLPDLRKKKEHYFGVLTESGNIIPKKVNWRSRRTGHTNAWWSKTRSVATIPKESFDNYQIFKLDSLPCDTCSERFNKSESLVNQDTCMQVDRFLMKNIQFKNILFNRKEIKVRAPKEYVTLSDVYFVGCNSQSIINWDTKKGKKKKLYYFSKLPIRFNYISNISRVMKCCKSKPEPSECEKGLIGLLHFNGVDRTFNLVAEIGTNYQQANLFPYAAIGISKQGYFGKASLFSGVDTELNFYASLRYQYHFLNFPFSVSKALGKWQSPISRGAISHYGRLYLGSELKTLTDNSNTAILEQNVHLGIASANTHNNALIKRIFIHYGMAYNYLENTSNKLYPIAQLGLNIRLTRFTLKK